MDHGMGRGPFGFADMRAPVTNAPYTATYTTTSTETLQDGTIFTHTTTRIVLRDSLGRTREEITMPARGSSATNATRTHIILLDPVARTITQLHPEEKTATVRALPQPVNDTAQYRHGPHGNGTAAPADNPNVVRTDLGSKSIAGIVATGKRTTRTIPAGAMGNAAPIVSTHEVWTSPDLEIELSRTDTDPFHGNRAETVAAITKAEPAAALFQIPPDYTVQQAPLHADHLGPHHNNTPQPPSGA